VAPRTAGCWKSSQPKSSGAGYALFTAARSAFAVTATILIEPEHEDGVPFLRVALGFRGGPTLAGLIALFRELALRPRLEN
jgi:hypothetical protein